MDNKAMWEKCQEFHGHVCPGLALGYRAALYIAELLDIQFSEDEDIVCVTENDACGVDAIQVLLGCSVGKGNLLFKIRGKQAFSFFNRKTGKSARLVLKASPDMSREEKLAYVLEEKNEDLFEVKEVTFELPERARIFHFIPCSKCGEMTAEHLVRIQGKEPVCLDCFSAYERFF